MAQPKAQALDPLAKKDDRVFGSGSATSVAAIHLRRELVELNKHPIEGISVGLVDDSNIFRWAVCITGPPETPYAEGLFQAVLEFSDEYPNYPPRMKFTSEMWHPNIYPDGRVCISILHAPGEDQWGYEQSSERWRPINSVESILICVQSMLGEPNDQSPANVDAAVMWRSNTSEFKKRVARTVRKSQEEI
ncbi:putative Ubiquitin-conjugating enzyme 7 (Ubc7) [Monocercomonoides exilis]|uniref:putative Ubiquitin-conjugating enzyme 7 (Ubc7) n=1 Tax=Monocercomonoides exilis TaxID=2049356 RepID=UPI00355A3090|nr:putative Ubiquitin-conjugating enzyme 7 (Ubc7) [Monocercomonoides exilis]|eukprot:MONOS_7052.1-p1 / transcript=MONOS_7052.1 / gene=MONOS_7052 / organism=Monocercomonoides_exilis_PA203 / gene_product=Ubiquitin-conjugating enzyme 7 (Ubc7) / transcript_product=Ubiquitin-conjugating enzyme 7 (Ubc7) / location=Mono_scaffold00233:23449-24294(+) / protein_length=191 / sequence_SO=supercontig / SO=protein_coding / is_pseudo=false